MNEWTQTDDVEAVAEWITNWIIAFAVLAGLSLLLGMLQAVAFDQWVGI